MAGNLKKINASGNIDIGELGRIVTNLQANVADALTPLQNKPILDGILLRSLSVLSGSNTIQHKLGRKIVGYFVVSQTAASGFHDDIQSTSSKTSFVLTATNPCTLNVWIF